LGAAEPGREVSLTFSTPTAIRCLLMRISNGQGLRHLVYLLEGTHERGSRWRNTRDVDEYGDPFRQTRHGRCRHDKRNVCKHVPPPAPDRAQAIPYRSLRRGLLCAPEEAVTDRGQLRESSYMRLRYIRTVCIVGALLGIAGCDPAALVKSKVPGPIKTILTFEGAGKPDPNKPIATIDLVQPKANSVHGSRGAIAFQANVVTGKLELPAPPTISWTLTSLADKQKKPLGSGSKVSKTLEAGQYEAEITVEAAGRKVSKKVAFRVVLQMPGRVAGPDEKPYPGVEIIVTDAEGTELSRTTTDSKGAFNIEVPAEGNVLAKPSKPGLCFYPVSRAVTYNPTPSQTEFTAVESEIGSIKLSSAEDPNSAVKELCPGEQALLSFQIKAKTPPKSFEITLVRRDKDSDQLTRMDQERDPAAGLPPSESRTLKVRIPSNARLGSGTWQGQLRITVNDEKGDRYMIDAPDSITIDPTGCFGKAAARATTALTEGKLEEAVTGFNAAEKLARQLEHSNAIAPALHNLSLNRALALLLAAQAEKPKSSQRMAVLENAVLDLNNLLRIKARDEQALFLKGLANYLAEDYKAALKDFDGVLVGKRDNQAASLLRAIACLKTGIKKNVTTAVDDLTQILTADPSNAELRKTRSAALRLIVQFQDRKDDERIDTLEVPVPSLDAVMDLKKYVRK
jgi:hypothetical protein